MRNRNEITSFYKFFPISAEDLAVRKLSLETTAARLEIIGLLIMAEEGVNGTVSGSFENIRAFEQFLPSLFENDDWTFKRSYSLKPPFKDFRVKLRPEIVTTRADVSYKGQKNHLSPEEWQNVLDSEDVILLDTRNTYETELGMFKGAIDPKTQHFSQFSDAVCALNLPKDKKILMYCTGGIRCEKAIVKMERLGYEEVYQLDGGILNYLEQFPHSKFDGECFVFDSRVAVDQSLNPSKEWYLCPHCGQPGREHIDCQVCSKSAVVCEKCANSPENLSCSKDCAYKLGNASRKISFQANL